MTEQKITDLDVQKALENEYDGLDAFLLVQTILELKEDNAALREQHKGKVVLSVEEAKGVVDWWNNSTKSVTLEQLNVMQGVVFKLFNQLAAIEKEHGR